MKGMARATSVGIMFLSLVIVLGAAASTTSGQVLRETLKNGMQVVIVRNTLAPVVSLQMNYLAGSNEAPLGFPGMAHAQEHMMFRGSRELSQAQLANLIADMGGDANAATSETITQYFFTVPAEDLDIALHIEAVRMQGVLDSDELWRQERGAIEQEVAQDLSSPMFVFYKQLLEALFAGTPYAHSPLGTVESFQQTTGAMLKKFHDTWYTPNNAILVVTGDVQPAEALKKIKALFEGIAPKKLPPKPAAALQPLSPKKIELKTDLPYGLAIVAYRMPGYRDPDYAAAKVLSDVLGSQRGAIYALVPEGKALMADFQGNFFPGAAMGFALAGFPHGGDGAALIDELKTRIAGYVQKGVPADLVAAAKLQEVTSLELTRNSISGLASEWSGALALKGLSSPEEGVSRVRSVTAEEINRVARKYLNNETAVVALLTPEAGGKAVAMKGPRQGTESFAPKSAKKVTLPGWAAKAAELPGESHSSITPMSMTLPNGLRLIVQHEEVSPTVEMYGEVKTQPDLEAPPGQEGVSDILDDLFDYGTESMDRLALQKAFDDIGAQASTGTSFSLQVLAEHFDRGVEILSADLLHPALPESAFRVVQQETMSAVHGKLQSPDYHFQRALKAGVYPEGDPSLRHPTPESVSSLKLEDVKKYYQKIFRPDLTTIVVIGNITPQAAREVVEKYFGAWTAVGPKPDTDLPPVPSNKPQTSAVPDPSRVQDLVVLAQTLGLTRANPDYYTLQVGNHVLSGGFYATRLYHDLREQKGLVYMVESALDVKKTRGVFEVVYACEPANVGKARAIIGNNLRRMQTSLVTAEELKQAKNILLRSIPLSEASMDDIASKLLHYAKLDLPLDEHRIAGRHYLETTSAQVREAFAKWVRPGDLVQVSLGPPPQ